jgi:hypothetical protein
MVVTAASAAAAIVIAIPSVIAAAVISTGSCIRINFTALKIQCAEGQRKSRK